MILFSTLFPVNDSLTKEAFVKLVIEWNQNNPHTETVVPGVTYPESLSGEWSGPGVSLKIQEYRDEDIVAARLEYADDNGVIWCSDFICNFLEQKLSVMLDRSYTEEAITVDDTFGSPYLIKMLSEGGYLAADGDLTVSHTVHPITEKSAKLAADIMLGKTKYALPVVILSRSAEGEALTNAEALAYHLKGAAHVLEEDSKAVSELLRDLTEGRGVHDGEAFICFPTGITKVLPCNDRQFGDIKQAILDHLNRQLTPALYTWTGVDIAVTRARLSAAKQKNTDLSDTAELLEYATQENEELTERVRKLMGQVEALTYELQGVRARLGGDTGEPLLYMGNERDFFRDEIKAIVLETLKHGLSVQVKNTRRYDVLSDIVEANPCEYLHLGLEQKLKAFLLDSKTFGPSAESELAEIGFVLVGDKTHPKYAFHGDQRYMTTLAKTPSDGRAGKNTASDIIGEIF